MFWILSFPTENFCMKRSAYTDENFRPLKQQRTEEVVTQKITILCKDGVLNKVPMKLCAICLPLMQLYMQHGLFIDVSDEPINVQSLKFCIEILEASCNQPECLTERQFVKNIVVVLKNTFLNNVAPKFINHNTFGPIIGVAYIAGRLNLQQLFKACICLIGTNPSNFSPINTSLIINSTGVSDQMIQQALNLIAQDDCVKDVLFELIVENLANVTI